MLLRVFHLRFRVFYMAWKGTWILKPNHAAFVRILSPSYWQRGYTQYGAFLKGPHAVLRGIQYFLPGGVHTRGVPYQGSRQPETQSLQQRGILVHGCFSGAVIHSVCAGSGGSKPSLQGKAESRTPGKTGENDVQVRHRAFMGIGPGASWLVPAHVGSRSVCGMRA
jgi:hypothetical protein